jgi:hypothetical protein
MVTTVIDPVRVPVITLSSDELEQIRADIAAGVPGADYLERYRDAVARNIFGFDAVKDRHGNYIEQGLGAKGHETGNHFSALKKAEAMGVELPGAYDKAVADIWKRDPGRAKKIGLPAPAAQAQRA